MEWLKGLFGSARRITVNDPLILRSPRIGFLNLLGPQARTILDEDKAALGPSFSSIEESSGDPPACDVLVIYARLDAAGRFPGREDGLRDMIKKSNAAIGVVASENDPKSYIAAAKKTGYGRANLVLTIDRNGAAFPRFFARLFDLMSKGKTMPLAWVELAPQIPGRPQPDCPETIFAAEISHIVFNK